MTTVDTPQSADRGGGSPPYPLTFTVDYPEKLDRVTTLLRLFYLIPILVVVGLLTSGTITFGADAWREAGREGLYFSAAGVGVLFWPVLLLLVFRRKYPRWWFDWNLNLSRFLARVGAYVLLLRSDYPSTDEEQAVHLDFAYPDASKLDQVLPIFKWFLAIPHYLVLVFLWIGAWFCTIIAWFAILFVGRYPRAMFDYVVGVMAWTLRVQAYAFLLVTDRYPPFSLEHP